MFDVELMQQAGIPIAKADYSWMDRIDSMSPEEFIYRQTLTEATESGDPQAMEAAKFYKRVWEAAKAQGNPATFSYFEMPGGAPSLATPRTQQPLPSLPALPKLDFESFLRDALMPGSR